MVLANFVSVDVVGESDGTALLGDDFTQGAHVGATTTDAGEGGDGENIGGVTGFCKVLPVGTDVDTTEIVAEGLTLVGDGGNGFDFSSARRCTIREP